MENKNIPDINMINVNNNPTISSPVSPYEIQFFQDRNSLLDMESYKSFLDNAISRFRKSNFYRHYKSYLIDLGMDRSQTLGNITFELASIELHHHILTVYDIAIIITEHILNTQGRITTFDLVTLLKQEHANNRVAIVMLDLTSHQINHNNEAFFIHPDQCFGNWPAFLEKYYTGITQDIAFKVLFYLKRALDEGTSNDEQLLQLRDKILDWSRYNN